MPHFAQRTCEHISVTKWCIVGYETVEFVHLVFILDLWYLQCMESDFAVLQLNGGHQNNFAPSNKITPIYKYASAVWVQTLFFFLIGPVGLSCEIEWL